MPVIDTSINQFINDYLVEENRKRDLEHEASGKLSASMLYQPVRFQVLKSIGAPRKAIDPYVLGKFKRGNDVEDWFVSMLKKQDCVTDTQKKVIYRDCIGFVDVEVDSNKLQFKKGLMPHEVKSVTNAKVRRIKKTGVDYHYKLQATLYALALKTDYYAVDIVSAEDLQVQINIFQTRELKADVDKIISDYQKAMENWQKEQILPAFEPNPKVAWTANKAYAIFDEFWIDAPDDQVIAELKKLGKLC